MAQRVACLAHNQKVVGSIPTLAILGLHTIIASIAQRQSVGLVNQRPGVQISLEAYLQ